jgi:hypothetical protein
MPKANKLRRHRPDLVPIVDEAHCPKLLHFLINEDNPPSVTPGCADCEHVLAQWNELAQGREARRHAVAVAVPRVDLADLSETAVTTLRRLSNGNEAEFAKLVEEYRRLTSGDFR